MGGVKVVVFFAQLSRRLQAREPSFDRALQQTVPSQLDAILLKASLLSVIHFIRIMIIQCHVVDLSIP